MIATPDLIDSLAENMHPVRRLRPPVARAACWLVLAAVIVALLAAGQGIRPDLVLKLHNPAFATGIAGAILTGILAAIATFLLSLPDRSRWWLLLPAPASAVWLSNIGYQCLTQWISMGPNGVVVGETVRCLATLVLTSLPLSLAMLVMLKYAAPLRPLAVALTGSLAIAAITATALSLSHAADASFMIILFNFGTAAMFVGLAGVFSRTMFEWIAPRSEFQD